MTTEPINPIVAVGDKIEVGFRIGGREYWHPYTFAVREVDPNGTPYVRFRFGKINKPAQLWRKTT